MKLSFENIKEFYKQDIGHGIDHIERVYKNALKIAETEKCDTEVVKTAAILHDIARGLDEHDAKGLDHAEAGAEMAREILKKYDYTEEQKNKISYCIKIHRYSSNIKPEIIEAGILQDADRLDALGAIIIARVFAKAGALKGPFHDPNIPPGDYKGAAGTKTAINHFYEKILKIKPNTFNTKKGQELALNRYNYSEEFLKQFLKEWNCED